MNADSEYTIEEEAEGYHKIIEILESEDFDKMQGCLQEMADNVHCNARWGNAANVYVELKQKITEALLLYESDSIEAVGALRFIAEALSEAQNDERDGLLLIENEFGLEDEPGSTHQTEKRLRASCGTTDWKILNQKRFVRIYR